MENILNPGPYTRGELTKTVADAAVPERITARTISAIQRYGLTSKILVTTTDPHGYVNGARVYIAGATQPEFNNITTGWMITVMSPTTFIFFAPGSTAAATGSPLTCYADIYVRQATVLGQPTAQTNNAASIRLGTSSVNGAQQYVIAPGNEIYLNWQMPPETRVNLGSYYVDVATGGDGVVVLYS